jgi:hypothetical protein
MRTVATFQSDAFNTTEERPYFINPCCFGDDVARWLVARLQRAGLRAGPEVGQEDFGWYFNFAVAEGEHCVVLGFRDDDDDSTWIAWVERRRGLLGSLLGRRRSGIAPGALEAVHDALQAPEIRNVRWHEQANFDAGREELGAPNP